MDNVSRRILTAVGGRRGALSAIKVAQQQVGHLAPREQAVEGEGAFIGVAAIVHRKPAEVEPSGYGMPAARDDDGVREIVSRLIEELRIVVRRTTKNAQAVGKLDLGVGSRG